MVFDEASDPAINTTKTVSLYVTNCFVRGLPTIGDALLARPTVSGPINSRVAPEIPPGAPFDTCGPAPDRELSAAADTAEEHPLGPDPLELAPDCWGGCACFRIMCKMCPFKRGSVNCVVRLLWSTKYTRPDAVLRCSQPCGRDPNISGSIFWVSKSRGIRGSCQVDILVGIW